MNNYFAVSILFYTFVLYQSLNFFFMLVLKSFNTDQPSVVISLDEVKKELNSTLLFDQLVTDRELVLSEFSYHLDVAF